MAKGKKTGGRDFKPGVSGNPKGTPGLPKEIRDARKFNQVELERVVNRLIYMTPDECAECLLKEPTYLNKIVFAILDEAANKGDHTRLEWVATRLIGKVTERVEVSQPKPFVITRADGSQLELGTKIDDEVED